MKNNLLSILLVLLMGATTFAQTTVRPMIWVKPSDKPAILSKIKNEQWAADYYVAFKKRADKDLADFQKNPKKSLLQLPMDWTNATAKIPAALPMKGFHGVNGEARAAVMYHLQMATDLGIMYFLTENEAYAQASLDIIYTFIEGMVQIEPAEEGHNGGGYLYSDDHLREAREIGAVLPIAYDFVEPFIAKGGKPLNVLTNKKTDFSIQHAEKVFKTYIRLALEHGIINCNWPVLESSSLVGNTLALSDPNERSEYLAYYLTKNTPNQDALKKVANHYLEHGGDWPESIGYSSAVASLSTYLMTLLTKYDPSLDLGNKYPQVPLALTTPYYLTYPNRNQTLLFGDGHRGYHTDYETFEMAYYLGLLSNNSKLSKEFGELLNSGISQKEYNRSELGKRNAGADVYNSPTHLLWSSPKIAGKVQDYPLPVTDELPFAGITLQRNLSSTGNPKDALMGFVGGGAFVHGHASGMNMELYGKGFVLGPKSGRGTYTTDLHENYYRLFASHNTVIVNGSSESDGGWVNLGINRVEQIALEPAVHQSPVSSDYSFTTSSFLDDKGDKAEAIQQRTLGIIRTSPTSGYYIDVFRSKSALPDQFHDYIYRNLADELTVTTKNQAAKFTDDPQRFMESSQKDWTKNKKFRHPGWHFFTKVETAKVAENDELNVVFTANKLAEKPISMKLYVNNSPHREITKALSPMSKEAQKPYGDKDNPTIVIRKNGEAWNQPFAVIYEPTEGNIGTIKSVKTIAQNEVFKGFEVTSAINSALIRQLIIVGDDANSQFYEKQLSVSFTGRYAVLTLDGNDKLISVYIGEGSKLTYKNTLVSNDKNQKFAAFIDFSKAKPVINSSQKINVTNK